MMRFLKSQNRGINIAIALVVGLLLIAALSITNSKSFYKKTLDITPLSNQEERAKWVAQNFEVSGFPYSELTDEELFREVRTAYFGKNDMILPSEAYYEFARRLKKEPNELDKEHYKQQKENCKIINSGLLLREPRDCKSPQEQRKVDYGIFISRASLLGNTFAQLEFKKQIYNNPSCCKYDLLVYTEALKYSNTFRKEFEKRIEAGDRFALFLSVLVEIKKASLSKEAVESLKKIATSINMVNAEAAFELFKIYKEGVGTTRSYSDAYAWLIVSHNLGYEIASDTLSYFENMIDKDFVIEGQKIAQEISKKLP